MKKVIAILILGVVIFAGCSSSKDTSGLSMEEHLNYAMDLYNQEDYLTALNEFQSILLQYPGSAVNDDAQFYLGMTYYQREEYILAAYEFSKLIRDISGSELVPDAQFMLSDSYYKLSPPYQLDQKYSEKAIEEFQAFIDFFPTNEKVEEAERKINEMYTKLAKKEFSHAVIYEKMDYYNAAMKYYTIVYETYHDTKFAADAFYNKIKIEVMKEMKNEALTDITKFKDKYPEDERIEELNEIEKELLNG